jgi:phosphoribosylformylglycinamidine synthase
VKNRDEKRVSNMNAPNALVLTGYGLNCDNETAYAFELAGARSERVHINSLINGSVNLEKFQILVFIGGFSNLVLGICNGFQTLANLGLLPGLSQDYQKRSVALTFNDCGNFRNQWVTLKADPESPCIFTRGIDLAELPVRHGEGKFYTDDATLASLNANHQVALQYALPDGGAADGCFPHNPNGSIADIAGICDPTGRIFGLMPHPEAYNHRTNHPDWTRRQEQQRRIGDPQPETHCVGIRFFQNAVDFVCA